MQLAMECGVQGVIAEIIGSQHLLEFGKKWTVDKAKKSAIEATLAGKDLGLKISFFLADSSRAEINFLLDLVHTVKEEGHMDSLVLVDTFGVFSPEGAAHRVRKLKAAFPDLPIEIHAHDDFGMGVSSTIAALSAGAEVAHVTVNGIGERAGGAQLEAVAVALLAMYGIDTGVDTTRFKELSHFVADLTRNPVPPTKPVVGDKIFLWETGLPSSLWVNCKDHDPLVMLPYKWTLTGQNEPYLLLGKKSGKDNVKAWLAKYNLSVPEEKFDVILPKVKIKSYQEKRDITEAEFRAIVKSI
jgi:methanogen homocitrate synthase